MTMPVAGVKILKLHGVTWRSDRRKMMSNQSKNENNLYRLSIWRYR